MGDDIVRTVYVLNNGAFARGFKRIPQDVAETELNKDKIKNTFDERTWSILINEDKTAVEAILYLEACGRIAEEAFKEFGIETIKESSFGRKIMNGMVPIFLAPQSATMTEGGRLSDIAQFKQRVKNRATEENLKPIDFPYTLMFEKKHNQGHVGDIWISRILAAKYLGNKTIYDFSVLDLLLKLGVV